MMADRNTRLDQQVHDAFEGVGLAPEAQERMLANLLAAQAARGQELAEGEGEPLHGAKALRAELDEADSYEAEVIPMPRKRRTWRVVLPVAAALLAGLVVIRIGTGRSSSAEMTVADSAAVASKSEATQLDAGMAEDAYEMAEEAPMAANSAYEESLAADMEADTWLPYPYVTLSDGTQLVVTGAEADAAQVGDPVEETVATDAESATSTECTVYAYGDGGFAVRYVGEDSYWTCERLS